jgi:tRNA nucleotidyltransferase (CCA-adding enzyme)
MDKIKEKYKQKKVIFLEVTPLKGKKDVVGCKLVKALEFINKKLIENDFEVFESGWDWGKKVIFYFVLDRKLLSENIKKQGPPLKIKEHVKEFKKKHKRTFAKKGRIFALGKRKFRKPEELIKSLFRDDYLKEKIKNIEIVKCR